MTIIRGKKWLALTLACAMLLPTAVFAADKEKESETEELYKEEKAMYLTDTVRVRAEANADSETVAFADRGDALTVLGEMSGWYHVRLEDPEEAADEDGTEDLSADTADKDQDVKEGYVKGTYLTEDKDEAVQAVAANDAEIKRKEVAAAAAAAAAAQAAASSGGSRSSKKKSSGKTVTGTQNVDDCDGRGHGTTITTYSDGSTSTSRY